MRVVVGFMDMDGRLLGNSRPEFAGIVRYKVGLQGIIG
jgi:hypothetical protein